MENYDGNRSGQMYIDWKCVGEGEQKNCKAKTIQNICVADTADWLIQHLYCPSVIPSSIAVAGISQGTLQLELFVWLRFCQGDVLSWSLWQNVEVRWWRHSEWHAEYICCRIICGKVSALGPCCHGNWMAGFQTYGGLQPCSWICAVILLNIITHSFSL